MSDATPSSASDPPPSIVDIPTPIPISRAPIPNAARGKRTATAAVLALPPMPKRRAPGTAATAAGAAVPFGAPGRAQPISLDLAGDGEDAVDPGDALQQAYAEIAQLQQRLQAAQAPLSGFFLDEDPLTAGNSSTRQPLVGGMLLPSPAQAGPQYMSSPYAGPQYVAPGQQASPYVAPRPLATGRLGAPTGGYAPTLPPAAAGTGALPHATQAQGQLSVLLNNASYAQYCKTNKTEGRVMATAVALRDGLCITHTQLSNALEGPEDFSTNPLFGNLVQFAHGVDGFLRLTDDLVSSVSQQMLFSTRQISAEMAVLCDDLTCITPLTRIAKST